MKNILVVELNKYHTQVFPIYQEYLSHLLDENELNFMYISHPSKYDELRARFKNVFRITFDITFFLIFHLQLRRLYLYLKLQYMIKKYSIDVLVFNSIEPKRYYKIFKKLKVDKKIGIVHNFGEIDIEKKDNEKYFVLADYAYNNLSKKTDKIDGYFCTFLPNIKFDYDVAKKDFIQIAISGHIDFAKRDFPFLIEVCKALQEKGVKNIKFNLVSSVEGAGEGKKLTSLVEKNRVGDYFIFHNHLDDENFFRNIYESDFVMPLVNLSNSQFIYERLTDSYSMATSYKRPLLIQTQVADGWEVDKESSILYKDLDSLVEILINLGNEKHQVLKSKFQEYVNKKIETNKAFLKSIKFD